MNIQKVTTRPEYISPDWLRCTNGYAFAGKIPLRLREDIALISPNLWDRVICVTLQAQAGDFRNIGTLIEVITHGPDVHIRDCSIRLFAQAAPSSIVVQLADVFCHQDYDARLEAYTSAVLTCDLRLAEALAIHRRNTQRFERDRVMDAISDILEPDIEDLEFADSRLDEPSFEQHVRKVTQELRQRYGTITAIYRGIPLEPSKLVEAIIELCREDDPEENGGFIHQLFSILEGITGMPFKGCLDDDCCPVFDKISYTLNQLHKSGIEKYIPGQRYFFGHPIPDYA